MLFYSSASLLAWGNISIGIRYSYWHTVCPLGLPCDNQQLCQLASPSLSDRALRQADMGVGEAPAPLGTGLKPLWDRRVSPRSSRRMALSGLGFGQSTAFLPTMAITRTSGGLQRGPKMGLPGLLSISLSNLERVAPRGVVLSAHSIYARTALRTEMRTERSEVGLPPIRGF